MLDFFLKRLNVDLSLTNGFIPYRDVINAFKDQSDPTKKRLNADNRLSRFSSRKPEIHRSNFVFRLVSTMKIVKVHWKDKLKCVWR